MTELESKLRHLPFFDALTVREPGSAEGRALTAGLVTLRLVDAWLEGDADAANPLGWNSRSVREAIEHMDEWTTQRALLLRIVEAIASREADIRIVTAPLMAYAQALEFDAHWPQASDVYRTVLSHLHPIEDGEASIAAHLRLAACYRHLNSMDLALDAFREAASIGNATGDMVGVLRGRLGEAQVALFRGNLPNAEIILDDTIARASTADLADVKSRALQDRSGVAILRGEFELAVRLGYQALGLSQTASERDKILHNIAGAFTNLGVYSAARDAYLVLSATAQEQYIRWAATLNLLEIASYTGMEPLFEQYRRQLSDQELPPQLATSFQLMLGQGYQRLGGPDRARSHIEKAIELAGEHGFSQLLFEAEQALEAVDTAQEAHKQKVERIPLDLDEVVEAIGRLRQTAGVA